MTDAKSSSGIYPRLCVAYFLQFFIWGGWATTLGGYADQTLKLDAGLLNTAIPLAAVSALFIGPIVDRKFSAQKMLALLHLIGGLCLFMCAYQKTFTPLFICMLLHGICYMPSLPLINSVVFRHIPNSNNAPRVFVFGTIGWIVVNLIVDVYGGGAAKPNFFIIGGIASVLLALYCLTLPDTPPQISAEEAKKSSGSIFNVLVMFKDPAFTIFAICVVIASIPACGFFFPMVVPLLTERSFPSPVALTTLNQFSELFFMLALPFFASRIGLKKCLLLGMAAWCLRYVLFMQSAFTFAVLGLFLHGFCYSFLYVAAYMYADKKAPPALKASVQSLMAFLLLGVGQVLGSLMLSYEFKQYPAPIANMTVAASKDPVGLPPWNDPKKDDSALKYLNLSASVKYFTQGIEMPNPSHLGRDVAVDDAISWAQLNALPDESLNYNGVEYAKAELQSIFQQVASHHAGKEVPVEEVSVTRKQWMDVQTKQWNKILWPPALMAIICCAVFLVLGKDPVDKETEEKKEDSQA